MPPTWSAGKSMKLNYLVSCQLLKTPLVKCCNCILLRFYNFSSIYFVHSCLVPVQVAISGISFRRVQPADGAVEVGTQVQFEAGVSTGSGITFTFRSNDTYAAEEEIVSAFIYFY